MGSFNKTCMVSDLTIEENKEVAVLFLKEKKNYNTSRKNEVFDVNGKYEVMSLPIYGEYDEYGKINNIKKDINVEVIESYYGLPIEDILDFMFETYSFYYPAGSFYKKYAIKHDFDSGKVTKEKLYSFLSEINYTDFDIKNNTFIFNTVKYGQKTYVYVDLNENVVFSKTKEKEGFFDIYELFHILHKYFNIFVFYKEECRKFVNDMLNLKVSSVMILKSVYDTLVELVGTDIQWYEEDWVDFDKFRNILKESFEEYEKDKKEIIILNNELNNSDLSLEETQKIQKNIAKLEMNIMSIEDGFLKLLNTRDYSHWQDRFENERNFNLMYMKEVAFNDDMYDIFKKFLSFEIVLESLGKYYRLPGSTPQFKSDRQLLYVQKIASMLEEEHKLEQEYDE